MQTHTLKAKRRELWKYRQAGARRLGLPVTRLNAGQSGGKKSCREQAHPEPAGAGKNIRPPLSLYLY